MKLLPKIRTAFSTPAYSTSRLISYAANSLNSRRCDGLILLSPAINQNEVILPSFLKLAKTTGGPMDGPQCDHLKCASREDNHLLVVKEGVPDEATTQNFIGDSVVERFRCQFCDFDLQCTEFANILCKSNTVLRKVATASGSGIEHGLKNQRHRCDR